MTDGDSDARDAREESLPADMAGNPESDAPEAPEAQPVTPSPEADTPMRQHAPAGDDAGAGEAATHPEQAPEPAPRQGAPRRGGFWPMLAGGVAAAAIGVFAAPRILPLDWFAMLGPGEPQLTERLTRLEGQLAALEAPAGPNAEIDGLRDTLAGLTRRLADLEARVADLATRPVPQAPAGGVPDEVIAALQDRLARQQAAIDELRDRFEAREAAARDSARAMLRRAALTRIAAALDSGEAFAPALDDLRETGVEVPEALRVVAGAGVPTHAVLVDSFPDAARAALAAARNETDERGTMTDFLRAQLGIRSLSPREGNDPDAILSRAEAALVRGRLADALAEIGTLPEGVRVAMSEWTTQAARRAEALAAVESLSQALN